MFKTIRATVAGLAALAAFPALAADLPTMKGPPPAPMPYYSWTGFYLGINVGYGWNANNDAFDILGVPVAPGGTKGDGIIGGAQIGYNWQNGPWVFGLEADIQGTGIRDFVIAPLPQSTRVDWFGTFRGRIGYAAWDRTMIYITGGGAVTGVFNQVAFVIGGSDTKFGWTAGLGIEHAYAGGWSAKLEGLYVSTGKSVIAGPPGTGTQQDQSFFLGRVGVNYRW